MAWVKLSLVKSLSLSTQTSKTRHLIEIDNYFHENQLSFTSQHKLQLDEDCQSYQARSPSAPTLRTSCQNVLVHMLYAETSKI